MKTTLLFLSVFLSVSLFGQQTYVPDDVFEAYCENMGWGNGVPDDNYVSSSSISSVQDLSLSNVSGLEDLTGIKDFTSLISIGFGSFGHDGSLKKIDISNHMNIESIDVQGGFFMNDTLEIDVSGCSNLKYLICRKNNILDLNLSGCTSLQFLSCEQNKIKVLDLSNKPNLQQAVAFLNCLECVSFINTPLNQVFGQLTENNPNSPSAGLATCGSLICVEGDPSIPAFPGQIGMIQVDLGVTLSSNCNYTGLCSALSNSELSMPKPKLIQILDLMGRETSFKPNTPLIYVYDDGSIEKVFSVEY